jgi:hypothetical protein
VNSTGELAMQNGPSLTAAWAPISVTFTVPDAGSTLGFAVGSTTPNTCFLIDDVSLVRTQ